MKNRLNRIRIGNFKLKANIAKFERSHFKLKKTGKNVDWAFDIPLKPNHIPSVSKNKNGRLQTSLVGESFVIHSLSELELLWKSLNVKDCMVNYSSGHSVLLDLRISKGDYTSFVEAGDTNTNEESTLDEDSFEGISGDNSTPTGKEVKSEKVAAGDNTPQNTGINSKADVSCPISIVVPNDENLNFESKFTRPDKEQKSVDCKLCSDACFC